jgi:hypothetical protein
VPRVNYRTHIQKGERLAKFVVVDLTKVPISTSESEFFSFTHISNLYPGWKENGVWNEEFW